MADKTQRMISKGVLGTAKTIDSFFKEETQETEENVSSLRLRLGAFAEQGVGTEFVIAPRLRLVLPYTEERLNLEFNSSVDENFGYLRDTLPGDQENLGREDEKTRSAALRYFLKATEQFNFSMEAGLNWDDGSPTAYYGPRVRKTFDLGLWALEFVETLRYHTEKGVESISLIDFDANVRENLLYRMRLTGDWDDQDDEFTHSIRFQCFQKLSDRRAVGYEWNNYLTNRPHHRFEEVLLLVRYRQRIWRDWLFYEAVPQLSFPRERDFEVTPGLLFLLEFYFGPEEMPRL